MTSSAVSTRRPIRPDVLRAGLDWFYETVQPPTALVEHRGVRFSYGARGVRFLPVGAAGCPLVVLDADTRPMVIGGSSVCVDEAVSWPAPLADVEIDGTARSLASLGGCITDTRNHHLTATFTLARPASASLLAAVDRWARGCPHHRGSQVCDAPVSSHGQACTWRSAGHDAAIWPVDPGRAWYERLMMESV